MKILLMTDGSMVIHEVPEVRNVVVIDGVRYRGQGTVTRDGVRFAVYAKAPVQPKSMRGVCTRCQGTGQFGSFGVCYKCSGNGRL